MTSRRVTPFAVGLLIVACSRASTVGSPTTAAPVSYLTRLGADTVTIEQVRRTGGHIEADLMQRSPVTTISHSIVEIGANGLATSWTFDPRLMNGSRPRGAATRMLTMAADSTTVVSDTGVTVVRRAAGGPGIPLLGNSMMMYELAIAYARLQGKDSVLVPLITLGGNRSTLPVRFIKRDSVRSYYGPDPVYIKLDAEGHVVTFDGSQSTNKIMTTRLPSVDIRTVASAFTVRDETGRPMGVASPRDTARLQLLGQDYWVDYSRPALRGRNPWSNGVLGDTIWRTGANAATQIHLPVDVIMSGQRIPAGTYSLWTHVLPKNASYELIINKQIGQWGTDYDPARDLVRVPLTVNMIPATAERFTISLQPDGGGGLLALHWGMTRLERHFDLAPR